MCGMTLRIDCRSAVNVLRATLTVMYSAYGDYVGEDSVREQEKWQDRKADPATKNAAQRHASIQ